MGVLYFKCTTHTHTHTQYIASGITNLLDRSPENETSSLVALEIGV